MLDVGCFLGFFCHEARRRNAGRVLGLDVDEYRLRQARQLAAFAGRDVEFQLLDVERDDLDDAFDVVLLLNVIHHTRSPLDVLTKVSRWARRRLVLEVPGLLDGNMRGYLKRIFGLRRRHIRKLERLPVIGVGRGGALDAGREQSFFFTPSALENILLGHRGFFARMDVLPSPKRGRFLAIAHRRQIGDLVVVAGPCGVGKTRLCERLMGGGDGAANERLGVGAPHGWRQIDALHLSTLHDVQMDRLLLHYDILRPQRGGNRTHDRDEALDLLACAERPVIYTLFVTADLLIQRLERRCTELGSGQAYDDARRAIALFRRPGELEDLYARWVAFCERRGVPWRFVDATDDRYPILPPGTLPPGLALAAVAVRPDSP